MCLRGKRNSFGFDGLLFIAVEAHEESCVLKGWVCVCVCGVRVCVCTYVGGCETVHEVRCICIIDAHCHQ